MAPVMMSAQSSKKLVGVSKFLNRHKRSRLSREVTLDYAHLQWFIVINYLYRLTTDRNQILFQSAEQNSKTALAALRIFLPSTLYYPLST